ncbi:MAG TPA: hypothetical protein VN493_08905 [Thermoanaerobaculia bacterium]|nr:hypothetical protein [Thermoanaerobaculia bacterium]
MATVFLFMSWVNGWCQVAAALAATDPVSHRMAGLPGLQTLTSRMRSLRVQRTEPFRRRPRKPDPEESSLGAASGPRRGHFLRSRS